MKSIAKIFIFSAAVAIVALCFAPGIVGAQNDSVAYKIGVVDSKKAFEGYKKQQTVLAALEAELKTKQAGIDKKKADLDTLQTAAEKATGDQAEAQRQKLASEAMSYKAEYERLQQELDMKFKSTVRKLKGDIDAAIQQVGTEGNYHLILDGDPAASGVLYFSTTIEITSQVIDKLNAAGN